MTRPRHLLSLIAAGALVSAGLAGATAQGAPDNTPRMGNAFVRGQAAIDRVGVRLPEVAAKYGLHPGELRRMLLNDETLGMDLSQRLAYFDVVEPADADQTPAPSAAEIGDDPFSLSSLPGAEKTIYLDFDGHVTTGTTWNSQSGRTSITSPAYSLDADTSTFNDDELDVIANSWAVVAEDFAPWNVNVTTIDPGTDALRRSGSGDTEWGVRVVITGDDWNDCGCGGFAYLGSFDDTADEPAFVFNSSFNGVSEAISHEVGHTLLLNHDGLASGTTYYRGHDTAGTPGWAPIMGASYYEPVTQWSRQEYFGANNTGEDDLAIIGSLTNGNNFGLRADDHGNSPATATILDTAQVNETGIIETRDDVDVFSFTTTGGDLTFIANNAAVGPNLDIALTLRDSAGNVVASDNVADGLDAGFDANVAAGTYSLSVEGVGVGNPAANPPSGYTDYGSIGAYTLIGAISGIGDPDTTPPAAPTGLIASEADGTVILTWDANSETDLANYTIDRAPTAGGPYTQIGSVGAGTTTFTDAAAPVGTSYYVVGATDSSGNESPASNIVSATVPEPPVDLTTNATADTPIFGTVAGTFAATITRGGGAQTITESDSGGKPNRRHDRAEHRWTLPASTGNQTLTVVASAAGSGDADTGFAVEYSTNGSTWVPFGFVANGASIDLTASIGAPTGNISVRVIDTDRTGGNRSHNSVTVDFIEITGDGEIVEPPTASATVASMTLSTAGAGRGQHRGVATVSVTDDLGNAVSGALVVVVMSGSFAETLSGATDSTGTVRLQTSATAKKPAVEACVQSISGTALPYQPGTESC